MRIAVSGLARAGKDTIGDYLICGGYTKVSFADPLYDILHYAQKICGFPVEKDRQFLQYIGSEWARAKDPEVWLKLAKKKIQSLDKVVITDLRFKNEMEMLREMGFIFIRVRRMNELRSEFGSGATTHISELEMQSVPDSDFDLVVDNNGTFEELYHTIDQFLKTI